jgi:hypothetical protein
MYSFFMTLQKIKHLKYTFHIYFILILSGNTFVSKCGIINFFYYSFYFNACINELFYLFLSNILYRYYLYKK